MSWVWACPRPGTWSRGLRALWTPKTGLWPVATAGVQHLSLRHRQRLVSCWHPSPASPCQASVGNPVCPPGMPERAAPSRPCSTIQAALHPASARTPAPVARSVPIGSCVSSLLRVPAAALHGHQDRPGPHHSLSLLSGRRAQAGGQEAVFAVGPVLAVGRRPGD